MDDLVTLTYPAGDDVLPRRVRHGFREYVGRPGEPNEVHPADVQLLLEHGWQLPEGSDLAELQTTSAKDLIAGLESGALDPERVRLAETSRPEGERKTVMEAVSAAASAAATSSEEG